MSEPTSNPIADLTYRNYDGPIEPARARWLPIAAATASMGVKKKGFWLVAALSSWYYVVMLIVFYVIGNFTRQSGDRGAQISEEFFKRIVWKDQFLHGFGYSQMLFLVLAIMLGAGAIANDNRSNALLVYLSKPLRKIDYLFGKWLGVAWVITLVALVPMLFFYLYCLMTYRDQGFLSQDPLLILRILVLAPMTGLFYSSLVIGISSLLNQGRLAGAALAGVYFLTYFFTQLINGYRMNLLMMNPDQTRTGLDLLWYLSLDGINIALAKMILGTRGQPPFNAGQDFVLPVIPPAWIFIPLALLICGGFLAIAWSRVRAVEVVR
ncbi:MAG TPA: ABC transporter permease subunit [Fimbriimonadaceae bacterium]|nr:ABC transporter permease subunit [Fimbriimonadaceae bacterium]HRJ32650.1 ABC transporter permease subunit [Fimbriimonadaceae bacterium]